MQTPPSGTNTSTTLIVKVTSVVVGCGQESFPVHRMERNLMELKRHVRAQFFEPADARKLDAIDIGSLMSRCKKYKL
ncbi:uncharacterized protein PITG_17813 [Phytophthora infestans T30-4]|uniref:Uncharacterized protein n=1 Tax=Phytophthora infestans (strain T30-4) TaxID=403677 RepID=D0NW50_PHYIT|nr:uncharacterized protein PITG_17813 [Phytophthora infestans T30-4]EEY66935.1 hypothetical protein PITG_17813 [Phytophthora infestans T30-4]|eukprot:XP_002896653.1 hypothetical protein PITG_17813 [Phytophthora infestans T30-4]